MGIQLENTRNCQQSQPNYDDARLFKLNRPKRQRNVHKISTANYVSNAADPSFLETSTTWLTTAFHGSLSGYLRRSASVHDVHLMKTTSRPPVLNHTAPSAWVPSADEPSAAPSFSVRRAEEVRTLADDGPVVGSCKSFAKLVLELLCAHVDVARQIHTAADEA